MFILIMHIKYFYVCAYDLIFNSHFFEFFLDVCDPEFVYCGRNAICISQNHQAVCECPSGMVGDPNDIIQGCQRKN